MSSQTAEEEEHIYTDAFVGENSWNGRERNMILLNRGDGRFLQAAPALGLDALEDARGLAVADFDLDGDLDLVVNNYLAPAALWINQRGSELPWIAFRLRGKGAGKGAPRDGVGANLRLRAGGRLHTRVVTAGHGYASQFSLEQHVGLGAGVSEVREVTVTWPGGRREIFGPFQVRQRYALVEGEGSLAKEAGTGVAVATWTRPPARPEAALAMSALLLALLGGAWFLGSPASACVP